MANTSGNSIRGLVEAANVVGPVRLTFAASLLLSLVAIWSHPVLNRDGMFYVEWANTLLSQGHAGLQYHKGSFLLVFLPFCIAVVSKLTGLGTETAGHLLNALLLAGACSLTVAITRQRLPAAAWAACLAVLAMPAYNGYRSEILREYGFWCLSILAFWMAMRAESAPRWHTAAACQVALLLAALFRLEAVAFYLAMATWQFFSAPQPQRWRRAVLFASLPLVVAVAALLAFGSGLVEIPSRLAYFLDAANPAHKIHLLAEAGRQMSDTIFKYPYSREESWYILLFGLLSIIPVKFFLLQGVLVVPLLFGFVASPARALMGRWPLLWWAFALYVVVLAAFVTDKFFLTGRYVSMLNLLAIPMVAAGLSYLLTRFPRWHIPVIAVLLLTMVSNVVSTTPPKTHIPESGAWLARHAKDGMRIYVENPRIAFYAGQGYLKAGQNKLERDALGQAIAAQRYDMVVIESPRKGDMTERWLAENHLEVVARFVGKGGEAAIVAVPKAGKGD